MHVHFVQELSYDRKYCRYMKNIDRICTKCMYKHMIPIMGTGKKCEEKCVLRFYFVSVLITGIFSNNLNTVL